MQQNSTTGVIFGARLSALMRERRITQVRLAEEFGVSQAAVFKWLKGTVPAGETLVRLAQFLGVTPEELIGLESRKQGDDRFPRGPLPSEDAARRGKSRSAPEAEVDALFGQLKGRVNSELSKCRPKETRARLRMLAALFGVGKMPPAKLKK